jgi:hypothetical protein
MKHIDIHDTMLTGTVWFFEITGRIVLCSAGLALARSDASKAPAKKLLRFSRDKRDFRP